jgi:DNA-binding response OmpR family regulator
VSNPDPRSSDAGNGRFGIATTSDERQQTHSDYFVSARANEQERIQAVAEGAVDFLLKPFSEDALLNAIQAALNR